MIDADSIQVSELLFVRHGAFSPTLKYNVGVVPSVFLNMEMKALGVL